MQILAFPGKIPNLVSASTVHAASLSLTSDKAIYGIRDTITLTMETMDLTESFAVSLDLLPNVTFTSLTTDTVDGGECPFPPC